MHLIFAANRLLLMCPNSQSVITSYSIHYTKLYETATTFIGSMIDSIDVCQAGYASADYKVAYVTASEVLDDTRNNFV